MRAERGRSDRIARGNKGGQQDRNHARGKIEAQHQGFTIQKKVPLLGMSILCLERGDKMNYHPWYEWCKNHFIQKYGDAGSFMTTFKLWEPEKPEDPTDEELEKTNDPYGLKLENHKIKLRQYYSEKQQAINLRPKMFAELISLISVMSEERVKAHRDYACKADVSGILNPAELAIIVDDVHVNGMTTNQLDRQRRARANYNNSKQVLNQPLSQFKEINDTLFRVMANAGCHEGKMTDEERADDFLHKVHPQYYGEVVATLDQNRLLGLGGYPQTVEEAYSILSQWSFKPAVSRPAMSQGTIFSSEISTDDKRSTRKGNKPQTFKTEPFDGECYNCGKRGHMAKDCWADGGGKEGQKPQRKSEQKPKSKKKDKAKVEDVKSSDVAYETDYIDDVYCCDFKLTENVNDTIIIYTDDCDIEICSNHMIVNNAGDKAMFSVGNNKIFRAENDYKVFLDSCATGMVIRNKNLVADIRKGAEVKIHPITDGAKSVMVGNLWGRRPSAFWQGALQPQRSE